MTFSEGQEKLVQNKVEEQAETIAAILTDLSLDPSYHNKELCEQRFTTLASLVALDEDNYVVNNEIVLIDKGAIAIAADHLMLDVMNSGIGQRKVSEKVVTLLGNMALSTSKSDIAEHGGGVVTKRVIDIMQDCLDAEDKEYTTELITSCCLFVTWMMYGGGDDLMMEEGLGISSQLARDGGMEVLLAVVQQIEERRDHSGDETDKKLAGLVTQAERALFALSQGYRLYQERKAAAFTPFSPPTDAPRTSAVAKLWNCLECGHIPV